MSLLIKDITIINEGLVFKGSLLIDGARIAEIFNCGDSGYNEKIGSIASAAEKVIEGDDLILIPGVIDSHVHFREPGALRKGDIASESAAAALGGVTSFMDMPNNNPPVCTLEALEEKYRIAAEKSCINYSFYLGANNENIDEIRKIDPAGVCGVKVFMGISTGNMIVDSDIALERIFKESPVPVATHCEDEEIIKKNLKRIREKWAERPEGEEGIPFSEHPNVRSRECCIAASSKAIALAQKYGTRLHILHISTAEETEMIARAKKSSDKISGEVCVNYLRFDDGDYEKYGSKIKCNPAIKSRSDRDALTEAVRDLKIDTVATDHAPHLPEEKNDCYLKAPSGLPSIQHSLQMMLRLAENGHFPVTRVVEMMCHAPARCFRIKERGFIRKGYRADLSILKKQKYTVSKENIAYKCGWSPLEGETFDYTVIYTFVNGVLVAEKGRLTGNRSAERLLFEREPDGTSI